MPLGTITDGSKQLLSKEAMARTCGKQCYDQYAQIFKTLSEGFEGHLFKNNYSDLTNYIFFGFPGTRGRFTSNAAQVERTVSSYLEIGTSFEWRLAVRALIPHFHIYG